MDSRVLRAMELLKEAGRLDLLAAAAAPRDRPRRRAACGVAAAVAACSPPRERRQVSGAGRGRSGRLALASSGRVVGSARSQPRPLGAQRPRGVLTGEANGGAGNPSGPRRRQVQGRPPGDQCRSEEGDPGELLASSEPWDEEEVLAGPSAASWAGRLRDGKAVRAKEVSVQSATEPGFAPPSGRLIMLVRWEQVHGGVLLYCRLEQVQAETENGHMTDVNGWEEKKTRQMLIG
ncbi:hypothetical protein NDU88_008184 [Pleurodeles waltl]|uniref:Uncharacterized protein n=1 Tax=Pleurodeles waltl TaxID=8319 RepID=A0AAV7PRE8_PLEWA|nr:hypothetical protein NDU88_008184 [Pleurodeles waltl]